MFVVVMGHVFNGRIPDTLRYYIYVFHMPLFFAISGAGFYLQTSRRSYSLMEMLENKCRGILWPYFVFSMICVIISMAVPCLKVFKFSREKHDCGTGISCFCF